MKIVKMDGSVERRVLAGMVTSTPVLGRVSSRWEPPGLFSSDWANLVGSWCVDFYRKAQKAPNRSLAVLFEEWASRQQEDDPRVRVVTNFLESLSDEYGGKGVNAQLVIDLAGDHFDRVRLEAVKDQLEAHLARGDTAKARGAVESWGKVSLGGTDYVDLLNDEGAMRMAFAVNEEEDLITYPGALGQFFHRQLRRGCFVACMATEKAGKTFGLMDIALTAVIQRRRTAYFECGDMTLPQFAVRLACKVAAHPDISPTGKWPCVIDVPTKISRPKGAAWDDMADVVYEKQVFDRELGIKKALRSLGLLRENKIRSEDPYFRFSGHPNSTLSVPMVNEALDGWKAGGFDPDVVVLDYADIMAPPKGVREPRDQANEIWKSLRALSQKRHCLVVTATQIKASGYKVHTLGREHFSEDKRKYAHTTALFGINMTADEKDAGIRRHNWLVKREGRFDIRRCVHVAGCLDIGAPALVSCW